jgi:hypothetical protein
MGQRAESVMLNKGTHILEDIIRIVKSRHYIKKRHVFREFTKQRGVFGDKKECPNT